jgi:predicted lysophospholipase L1 biosynthesis ABC-type transport system permease subunit
MTDIGGRFAGKDIPSSQGLSGLQKYLDDCLAVDRGRFDVLDVAARIALVSAAAGIVIGLACDSFLGTVLAHWMQNSFTAGSLFAAAALLALSALLACLLPSRHASSIPPTEALRYE